MAYIASEGLAEWRYGLARLTARPQTKSLVCRQPAYAEELPSKLAELSQLPHPSNLLNRLKGEQSISRYHRAAGGRRCRNGA